VAEDDFDLGGFDEAYSPDDFSQADMDFATAVGMQSSNRGSDDDSAAQFIANQFAKPQAGIPSRSNVIGMANYDPQFAAALDISRGLDPTNNMGGIGGLAVPSYLRPQLPGNKVLNEAGDRTMYFSPVERFMQEDLADIAQSGFGLTGLVGKGLDALLGGIDFLSNSKAGNKIEDVFEEEKRKEIAELELTKASSPYFNALGSEMTPERYKQIQQEKDFNVEETFGSGRSPRDMTISGFEPNTFPSITKTNLDGKFKTEPTNILDSSFMDAGASLSTNPNVVITPDIDTFRRDIANASNAGITALSEAKPFSESINNQEIAAGAKKGSTLTDRELEDTANFADYLNRINKAKNEYGLYENAMSQLFANRQKVLPKEVQSQYNENLYPKDVAYLNKLAEEENVARTVVDDLISLGPKRDFTSQNVNIIPDIFNKDGYTLENKYFSDIFTPKQVKEMQNKGYSLQGIENLRTPKQFPTKKTVPFSSLSDKLKEQYFLNTNLDYGAPIKTPYNVVY